MIKKILIILLIVVFFVISTYSFLLDTTSNNKKYIQVEIRGEVEQEKTLSLPLGSTFNDALKQIDLTEESDTSMFSYLDVLYNNQIIVIPKHSNNLISINNADIDSLVTLPGIGNSIASRIIEYREKYGNFVNLDELKNVKGIGEKKFNKIKPYICL